ncbi:rod shape-determining protein MreC [Oryzomonas sagensis]|uniref:Cell shape-determining protein MreC n=1 Tax=Oryzomonas sagensis TaxID=2603857 RepID=A0ABQ6TM53_9BACT|nr:rod shape-determining protein MreC [Oryzomonas sagensis]KAB0669510.1 rod shape-determining protein MreC [Oryzomonas sagensis]
MDFIKKYALFILTAVAILAALIFYSINIPHKRDANIVERGIMTVFGPIAKPFFQLSVFGETVWTNYLDLVNVRQENLHLIQEVKLLNSRLIAAEEMVLANKRLSQLLDVKNSIKAPTLAASVIGEDLSPWFGTLVIDRGSSSGITEGMAVVAADGIVGQIVKVAPSSSRVLLLTDHSSGIAATIQRSRARGVVKGKGDGLCQLEFATRGEDVKVGDMVVSSGIGGVFLKGLPIGEVTMVKRGEYGIFQTITIRPTVNITHLEDVLVVVNTHD